VTYGLSKGEGFVVITGEVGAGKTTLVNYLLARLQDRRLITAKVVTTQLEADNLLRMVASAFGIPHEGIDKATLLNKIEAFLINNNRADRRPLLIVDEVQNLAHSSLEELRMLSNFQLGERPLLQFYLVGQPQFRQTLASQSLLQLRQRVIASHHLQPLDADETRGYIEHRLQRVGWQDDPSFADGSFAMIFEATGGVPREINLLCDRLLLFGFLEERHRIDTPEVDEVLSNMRDEGSLMPSPSLAGSGSGESAPGAAGAMPAPSSEFERLARRITALEEKLELQQAQLSQILSYGARKGNGSQS
jgi:putative secretion ATPase (PEP-CTERM system associated)